MRDLKYRVIIDTDPGLGSKILSDVDDGLTLFLILNNPEIFEIEGITTVYGNTPVKTGYALVEKYLELANKKSVPHKLGAKSKNDYGVLNDASKFLIETVKENPKEITLLTLGPLTNIGTALQNYSEFFDDLKQIVFMGGVIEPIDAFSPRFGFLDSKNFNETEFNFYNDPIATKKVIEAETFTPRVGMGLDICCRAVFKDEHFEKIKSVQKPVPQFVATNIRRWLDLWKQNKSDGFYPFDTFVPIYLLKPDLFKSIEVFLKVDIAEIPGKLNISKVKKENSAPITYCVNFAKPNGAEKFMEILVSNLIK